LALQRQSVAVFNDLRQAVQHIDVLSDPTKGELRIGATDPVAVALVSPVITDCRANIRQCFFTS
jgi:DNA-binding transcriptional LysR family regulator